MEASSRAPAPPPLKIGPVRAVTSPALGTPRSADSATSSTFSGDYYASLTTASRSASTSSPLLWASHHDTSSSAACPLATRKPSALVATRKVNANSYCGRHSDEFLFGGKGLGDLWRAVTKK